MDRVGQGFKVRRGTFATACCGYDANCRVLIWRSGPQVVPGAHMAAKKGIASGVFCVSVVPVPMPVQLESNRGEISPDASSLGVAGERGLRLGYVDSSKEVFGLDGVASLIDSAGITSLSLDKELRLGHKVTPPTGPAGERSCRAVSSLAGISFG
ncbi:unnamed protein product [Diplocarpon coronariae]